MADFEFIEADFIDTIRQYDLKTKQDFVDFFMVYYEFTVSTEYDDAFPSLESQQEYLMNALNKICDALNINYEEQYSNLTDFELKQLWWYLEISLAEKVFKNTKPVVVQNATENFKNHLHVLNETTLEIEKMFLNVIMDEIPFAPRPIFNTWYKSQEFDSTKTWFLKFCKENEKMFSLKKIKEGLLLPYELPSKFLNTHELMFDIYIVSLFEILKVVDENNKEQLLSIYVSEFFKNSCVQKLIKEKHKQELLEKTLILTDFLLKDCEEDE